MMEDQKDLVIQRAFAFKVATQNVAEAKRVGDPVSKLKETADFAKKRLFESLKGIEGNQP